LIINSPQVQYQAIYDMTGKWQSTDHGREHVEWPQDYVEPFFHDRSVGQFFRLLQGEGVLTAEQLAGPPKTPEDRKNFRYVPNPLIRLTRAAGKPCWTFGVPTAESNSKGLPMLWVEQDVF